MKTILILGANGRIGFELSKFFLNENCKIIAVDKSFSQFKYKDPSNLLRIKIDLSKEKNFNLLIKKISNQKKIDGVVYCLYPKTKSWGTSFEKVNEKHLKENLYFQLGKKILFLKNIYDFFKKKKMKSSIVMLSSIQGIRAPKFEHYKDLNMHSPIEYSASKAGIISITEYLAKYINNKDLRINCISPGGILDNQKKEFIRRYKKACISKGMLESKDLCATVMFLISADSNYIRGQNIVIDDGWSL